MANNRRGQWSVLAVNSVTAITVLVLVAVLALVVKPPAPPGIAAFAPQAAKPITKAPQAQSAQSVEGAGECGEGQDCTGAGPTPEPTLSVALPSAVPTPTGPAKGVPSALQCYSWPDGSVTQTFDPQSPPCIASWDEDKGNGGATSPGVSATEIRVALPVLTSSSTWPGLKPMVDFVNTRYQLYGRRITVVPFISQQADKQFSGTFNDPTSQRADAAQVPSLKVFASFDFVDPLHYSMSLPVFRDFLTKNRIISLAGGDTTAFGTTEDLERNAPYEWTYYPTIDEVVRNVATMVCRQLAGKPAVHAPDRNLHGKVRKLAIVLPTEAYLGGSLPGLAELKSILSGCGVVDPKVVEYDYAASNRAGLAASFRELADDGVTSLVFFPQGGNPTSHPMAVANSVGFNPEWVMIGNHKYLVDLSAYHTSQTVGAFGVGTWNKMPQLELEMWVQAYTAAGGDPSLVQSGALTSGRAFYNELLLLAAGIQMAGPDLTPATFAAGLQSTDFPNPRAGRAPSYQGAVGFEPGDVTMLDDLNAFWMTTEMSGTDVSNARNNNTEKATCYVGLGRRFRLGTWPTTDGFYRGGCR